MVKGLILGLGLFLSMGSLAKAAARQDVDQLVRAAQQFVENELKHRPSTFKMGKPDARVALPACDQLLVGWGNGAARTGATFVDVSCPSLGWSLRLPVTVTEKQFGVVTTRALRAGQILTAEDLKQVELVGAQHATRLVVDASQAVGKMLTTGLPLGAWLREFMLRAPQVIRANQPVKVAVSGKGFSIQAEGTAVNNASVGERASVRMASGRVVSGTVMEDGIIAVLF